jgi:predicted NAD/FAD-dependent oxidoreductase
MKKVAIIGAGLSGLCLANDLVSHFDVTIFEKSRSVGGRLATRYSENYEFDHGAQFFSSRNKHFMSFLKELEYNSVIKRWDAEFVEIDANKISNSRKWNESCPHFVGVPKMNSIAKYLAKDLNIKLNTKITNVIKVGNQWELYCSEGNNYNHFDWLFIAIPVAQAKEILSLYINNLKQLDNFKMTGCYALMLGFMDPLELNFDVALVKNKDISLISVNSSKPERKSNFSMVVLSTNKWAEANLEKDQNYAIKHLMDEASFVLNKSLKGANHVDLHKWRYANSAKVNPTTLIDYELKLALCGDWSIKGVLEGAFLSAKNLYLELKKMDSNFY